MRKLKLSQLLKNLSRAGEVARCFQTTSQWADLTQAYLGLKSLTYPYSFKTRKGQKLTINTFHDLVTVWVIFFREEYKIPNGAQVVIDAGANIGTFSVYASGKNVKKIYAIEPFPETHEQLSANIKLNNLSDKVDMKAIALADSTGTRTMDLSEGPSQSRGLLQASEMDQGLKVSTYTLADFLKSIGQDQVDLLKIDIEGGEHEVFHSSSDETLRKIKSIAMEYHPNKPKKELFDRIQRANFKLTHDFAISEASGVAYFSRC